MEPRVASVPVRAIREDGHDDRKALPILAGAAYGVIRIAAVSIALNRWRSESGFAGTLCVISTITVWSFGSIQKIVPAVPSQPYSPTFGESFIADGSTTTFTFASPQPMPPPRARRIGSGKLFAVMRS